MEMKRTTAGIITLATGLWAGALQADTGDITMKAAGEIVELKTGSHEGVVLDDRGRVRLTALAADGAEGTYTSPVRDMGQAGSVTPDWIAQWTTPQRWEKHSGNPIFGPKQTGGWDTWCNGVSIVRNPDNLTYKMFHCGRAGSGVGFAEARIADPLTWTENPASPVFKARTDNWEGNFINQPRVVKVTDTHWRMYYTGWGFKGEGTTWAMGLAESHDSGVTWKRVLEGPLVERGDAKSPDGGGACVPMVIRVGDLWYMWYTAMVIIPGRQSIHLCLATSSNGVDWVKHPGNPVLSDDFTTGPARNVTSRNYVRYENGVFQMWYSHAKPEYRIRYAESLDGIHWERSPLPLALDTSAKPAWDDDMVEYPEVDVVDGQWRLWFCGNDFGTVGFATGVVESTVAVSLRSGPTPKPDKSWSGWSEVARGQAVTAQRYVQAKAALRSQSASYGPALTRLTLQATVATPDSKRDTVSPSYNWKTFPYRWPEIVAEKFTLTPVHWQRHPDNPVLNLGMNNRPIRLDDNTIRMFFGRPGKTGGIFYFDVDPANPAVLKNGPIGPLLSPGPDGTYDDDWLICPEPVKITETHWRMYYSAKRKGAFFGGVWSLACADSHDGGKTWTKHDGNPIMTVTQDNWESGAVGFPSVEKDESGWRMWYLGTDQKGNALKQVGYATSTDGLKWLRHQANPVLPVDPDNHWEKQAIAVARVIRDGRLCRAWYCSYPQNDTYAVGFAESVDGIHWTRSPHNPILKPGGAGWDSKMKAYPGVVRVGDRYFMWYSGNGYHSAIGLATADVPRGKRWYRTGPTAKPDARWSTWQPLPDQEPTVEEFVQFAVVKE
jgi:predicted GH43/DUF377 family glycosyl hydrolase